ncbi:E3 ubiquitin-protein ligase MBR2-like isoform X2 [Apium graveolens]|uniref:E3 ubiquitin-protein ligase MBR2-like isoform X2 n=1 Tax=Apium graveolens TaxID=4045 RepID=UPI003D7B3AA4
MQGQRRAINSFTETMDLNQDLYNDTNMDQSAAWNNVSNPAERRLPHNARSFSGWDLGESSSSANPRDQVSCDGLKGEPCWPSSHSGFTATEARLEERRCEPPNILRQDRVNNGLAGNQISWENLNVQSSDSSHYHATINLNDSYPESDDEDEEGIFPSFYKSGRFVTEPYPSASMSTGNGGTCDNSRYNNDGSGSSMGNWGSSCKRKALEGGTSTQPYPGGNTSFFPQPENIVPHNSPARHIASNSLGISSSSGNYPGVIRSEQMNPRFSVGMRGFVSDVFPPVGVPGIRESSTRNSGARITLGHQEPDPFSFPPAGNTSRQSNVHSLNHSSRPTPLGDSLEFGPSVQLPGNPSNQSHVMPGPFSNRNISSLWNDAPIPRTGSSSSSFTIPRGRGTGLHDDAGFRSNIRNNEEHPMFVPATHTRNMIQDPTSWSLGTGSSSTPGGIASSSRAGPSSSSHPYPAGWLPHHNFSSQNQFRLSDYAPWSLFPPGESESGIQRGQFLPFSSRQPSSPEETAISSRSRSQGHNQPFARPAYIMDIPGEEANGWRSLAADIDGRQRLVSEIRQVLNVMRRGENIRAEDMMIFDPFINGVAELHDRHRDMRLDVDNMSYEELLALEERIGDVNTGLSDEVILRSLKERKFSAFMRGLPSLEPCCICQEEYVVGESIGTLDCGHDFHSHCIKQWLRQKNTCPICKMTGIGS